MSRTSSRLIRIPQTPYNNFISKRDKLPDVYDRSKAMTKINQTILVTGNIAHVGEYVLNVMSMSDELLFDAVDNGKIKNKDEFDANVNLIIMYIKMQDFFSPVNILLEDGFNQIKREEKLLKSGAAGVRGIAVCPRCKKDNIIIYNKQKSRGDEGETQFNTCTDCNNKWTVN